MRISFYKLLLLFLSFVLPSTLFICVNGHAETIDRVVAVVNDQVITYADLEKKGHAVFKRITEEAPAWQVEQTLQKAREEILDHLIDQLIIEQRAKKYGVSVSDEEIDAAIQNIMAENHTTLEAFRKEIAKTGNLISEYRDTIKTQILQAKLVNLEVRSKVVINEEKIKDYYNRNYVKASDGEGYHILQIGISWNKPEASITKEAAKQKIDELKKEIVGGKNFKDLARSNSDLPSAADGGDIGVFSKNELALYMRDTITNMKPGELSPVIETPEGYQFFKLLSVREGNVVVQEAYDKVKEEIKEHLYKEELKTHFDKWVSELREEAYIKKKL